MKTEELLEIEKSEADQRETDDLRQRQEIPPIPDPFDL